MIRLALILALLAIATAPSSAIGSYTVLYATIDELVERQSLGLEASLFGDHMLLEEGDQSIALHPFMGGYGEDAILVGLAASWHTSKLLPVHVGANVSVLDADVPSVTFGVSAQHQVWSGNRTAWLVQASVAYQNVLDDATAIYLKPGTFDERSEDLVLFDTLTLGHAMLHTIATVDLVIIRAILDIGWIGTTYHFDANECESSCFEPGAPRNGSGSVSKTSWGLGASLNVKRAIIFGGFKVGSEAAFLQANVGWAF